MVDTKDQPMALDTKKAKIVDKAKNQRPRAHCQSPVSEYFSHPNHSPTHFSGGKLSQSDWNTRAR